MVKICQVLCLYIFCLWISGDPVYSVVDHIGKHRCNVPYALGLTRRKQQKETEHQRAALGWRGDKGQSGIICICIYCSCTVQREHTYMSRGPTYHFRVKICQVLGLYICLFVFASRDTRSTPQSISSENVCNAPYALGLTPRKQANQTEHQSAVLGGEGIRAKVALYVYISTAAVNCTVQREHTYRSRGPTYHFRVKVCQVLGLYICLFVFGYRGSTSTLLSISSENVCNTPYALGLTPRKQSKNRLSTKELL